MGAVAKESVSARRNEQALKPYASPQLRRLANLGWKSGFCTGIALWPLLKALHKTHGPCPLGVQEIVTGADVPSSRCCLCTVGPEVNIFCLLSAVSDVQEETPNSLHRTRASLACHRAPRFKKIQATAKVRASWTS